MPAASISLRSAARGDQIEAQIAQRLGQLDAPRVAVARTHADEGPATAASAVRNSAPSCDLTKASPKLSPTPITSPVDFISGPRMVSTPGNLRNGNTASFTEKYGGNDFLCRSLALQRNTGHRARGNLRQRHTDRLGHKRHGARRTRIHFEHVDCVALHRELHVHQADHVQRLGHRHCLAAAARPARPATGCTAAANTPSRPSARRPARCAA